MLLLKKLFGRQKECAQSVSSDAPRTLVFKDNESAFAYACEYMDCRLTAGSFIPALVKSIKRKVDGSEEYEVLVASGAGGFLQLTYTSDDSIKLSIGDLVAFWVGTTEPRLMGLVPRKLMPEYCNANGGWNTL
ncbi:hypothetical protein [Pandoraea sputorum]|uniref:hypothetical protein n=1 Tax=Pandoraea sputorum TaxID=93222 RepID=UPI002AF6B04B|nr:hypothetical protein [Pandoraea sputorum]